MEIKNNFILLIGIFLLLHLYSCERSLGDDIEKYLDEEFKNRDIGDSCIIDFRNIIQLDWDSLYNFIEHTSPDFITKTIGFEYNGEMVPDSNERLMFTKNKTVIYENTYKWNIPRNFSFVYMGPYGGLSYLYLRGGNKYIIYKEYNAEKKVHYMIYPHPISW